VFAERFENRVALDFFEAPGIAGGSHAIIFLFCLVMGTFR
jgi:hypothetical protein